MGWDDITPPQKHFMSTYVIGAGEADGMEDALSAADEKIADASIPANAKDGTKDALSEDEERQALIARIKNAVTRVVAISKVSPKISEDLMNRIRGIGELVKTDLTQAGIDFEALLTDIEKAETIPAPPPMEPPSESEEEEPAALTPEQIEAKRAELLRKRTALDAQFNAITDRGAPTAVKKMGALEQAFRAIVQTDKMDRAEEALTALDKFVKAQIGNLPAEAAFDRALAAIGAGAAPDPNRLDKANGIATKYPGASRAAADALNGFAGVLGDTAVTPALLAEAKTQIGTCETELEVPKQRLERAKALPEGDAQEAAVADAEADLARAEARLHQAIAFEKAARGKQALTDALTLGVLSPNSSKALDDDAATALIESFVRNPELATKTAELASTVAYPNAMAKGLPGVITAQETGFASLSGKKFDNEDLKTTYAEQLVQMGGNVGEEYFARMDSYLMSGRQFEADPTGDLALAAKVERKFRRDARRDGRPVHQPTLDHQISAARAQKRSTVVADALLDGGELSLDSPQANEAIGDLLFNPSVLRNPQPALNNHVLETVEFLSDADNKKAANEILDDIPDTPEQASRKLVRRALGKGRRDAVTKEDAQQAVMASMLKSLDQGPVGSCFSTAPLRKLRADNPLGAMDAYAQIAGTGEFKPASGPKVPVVRKIPPNEDPIMRSLEYSLATSVARKEKSVRSERQDKYSAEAANDLASLVTEIKVRNAKAEGGIRGTVKAAKEKIAGLANPGKMRKAISDAFTFVYDSTSEIELSDDGKSTQGRYVIVEKATKNEMTSEAEYTAAIARVAIDFVGCDPASPDADEIRALVTSPDFIAKLTPVMYYKNTDAGREPVKYEPWALSSGGTTANATKTVFGDDQKSSELAPLTRSSTPREDGARVKKIVTSMVDQAASEDAEMIVILTKGQHGFNAVPNHPSLAPLQGRNKTEREAAIQRELIDKGTTLAAKAIPVAAAQKMFDDIIAKEKDAYGGKAALLATIDRDAATNRPTTDVTTTELHEAVKASIAQAIEDAKTFFPNDEAWNVFKDARNESCGDEASKAAITNLDAPEFVIADTNWGSPEDHTFFVVVPDPLTGQPRIYQKTEPPGSLYPLDRDWTDKEWAMMK